MSEKCTASVFRVTEPSSGGCRSKLEEWICRLDRKGGGNFAKSKLWKGEEEKLLCCPSGSSEFQTRVSQFMKIDCMEKKAMLSSKTMRQSHLTPRHLPGDHSLQQHCCQNSNLIFVVRIKNYREFWITFCNVFLHVAMFLYPPSEDTILLPNLRS